MLHHLLKLIWKRKSRNMMLSLEILLAFMVVFAIAAFAVRNYQLYQMPIGFAWRDQWSVAIRNAQPIPNDAAMYDALKRALLELPEVEKVAFTSMAPYEMSRMNAYYALPDGSRRVESDSLDASDDFFDTMQMTPAQGRWFSKADDGADAIPTVINRLVADKLFPGIPAIGQVFTAAEFRGTPRRYRVSAVVEHYRSHGEYMEPVNLVLPRFIPGVSGEPAMTIMLRVKPGTPRAFEARLSARLKREHGDWSFVISPLSEARKSMSKLQMVPMMVMSVIAAFLLVMVAFGLFGVLWQNTTQRIPEIGLRRALGADAGHIYRQIIAEQMLLSTAAMAVALVLLVQLPLTGAFPDSLNWPVFFTAAALSAGVIYLLSLLCSLYPGWRAARLSPTQALHYE
ncbi:putative ABC transport system permease protein [Duganella sp. 1411]|uniref:ABC transporter permease n=1 Tax=Duganella sp. 1411 TaxID=2806572 RepID=UPI001AE6368C|nr:FtsX-like permease family protein [Duganella sp. 1411]MBP1205328.1 putative ABC transport system permease protein [Duganella sp. 1411]